MTGKALSVEKKLAMVLAAQQPGVRIKDLCAELGVHRDTLSEWRRRYRAEGLDGLIERSRRPLRSPNQTPSELEDEIVRLRKQLPLDNGADVIGWHLRRAGRRDVPSDRTIHRILVRRGMVTPQPQKRPKSSYRRFEFDRPNECWQIDATEWQLARRRPVTIMDVVDDHSRALTAIRAGTGPTTELALETILAGGAVWGLPAMVLSDNGVCFAGLNRSGCDFESVLAGAGVRVIHSRPYHPETCGKVERFHGTLKRWLGKQPLARSMTELQAQLDAFAAHYNHDRRSAGDDIRTPAERHAATPAATPAPDALPINASPKVTITAAGVRANGMINIADWKTSVGTEHAGRRLTVVRYGQHAVIINNAAVLARVYLDPERRYIPSGRPRGGPRRRPH
ncbi:MAG TPA: IS481 family transposase [Jatrophihabitantaceae bacterium]|nr:IS481 family transposase [Jatrophihabitantaceae bacterium]